MLSCHWASFRVSPLFIVYIVYRVCGIHNLLYLAFAEYQIERSDLTSDVNQEYAPRREFRQFAMRVLYPGLESHPILEPNVCVIFLGILSLFF